MESEKYFFHSHLQEIWWNLLKAYYVKGKIFQNLSFKHYALYGLDTEPEP